MFFQEIIVHLTFVQGFGPAAIQKLVDHVGLDQLNKVYEMTPTDFAVLGFSPELCLAIVSELSDRSNLDKELELMRNFQAGFVTFYCQQYPKVLKEIHVPPIVLYYQGDVTLFAHEKNIACVGARKAHRYVHEALMHLVVPMMHDGWVVVSGGAAGADTYAHQIALDQGKKTIVIVGSGLCHQYPPQNKKLFENVVAAGGLIVSCFPMNMHPEPHCFPIRNRLISGLSRGCLVLQAAAKSGALITAECALQQGREVFALPGSIFDPLSAGCHSLIQQGAKLVTSSQDILEELDYGQFAHYDKASVPLQQKLFEPAVVDQSNDLARQILQCAVVPITADMLMTKLGVQMQILQNILFDLSLDGKISQDAMGFWKRL